MDEDELRREFERQIRIATGLIELPLRDGRYDLYHVHLAWTMYKEADARARRECAEICVGEHNRLLALDYDTSDDDEAAYQQGKQVSASKLRNDILATIKEPPK